MTRRFLIAAVAFLCIGVAVCAQDEFDGQNCTSIIVGRLASTDGSVITSHTCDGKYRTWAVMEPAADYPAGSVHEVLRGTMKTSSPEDRTGVSLVGTIPEASHTYAYLNTAYPCLNEKQLAIGETTFGGPKELRNSNGLFTIEELERIALQRCSQAREAVLLMGSLAEKYGYNDGGECLTVADKNEVWQFEIVGSGTNNIGAAWVAKRLPDGEVGVSANVPRIGVLERDNPDGFLCSSNVEQVARDCGLWNGKGVFKFWKVFNCEYGHGRNYRERELYILSTLAPSLGLNDTMDELPFSVKPESPVDVRQVIDLFRATYEGTALDMCKGVTIEDGVVSPVANPWLTTDMRKTLNHIAPGSVEFARNVSVAWCAYSTVIQLRSWLPDSIGGICWLSLDNPGQSPRIPVFAGSTRLPDAFLHCGQNEYNPDYALWKWRKANKLATVQWQATKKDFMANVMAFEDEAFAALQPLEDAAASHSGCSVPVCSEALNACTQRLFDRSCEIWAGMEASFWVKFGLGF